MICSTNQLVTGLYKAWRAVGLPVGPAREIGRLAPRLAAAGPTGLAVGLPAAGLDRIDPDHPGPPTRTSIRDWRFSPTVVALHGPSIVDLLVADPGCTVVAADPDSPALLDVVLAQGRDDHGLGFDVEPDPNGAGLVITVRPLVGPAVQPPAGPHVVDDLVWTRVQELGARLLVPASEASRAGAGAGTIDND